ncbi:hypothetical protein BC939DRAFT_467931 [Gamsiella multidivaricata]|uniref:uncharacterized protein n=1 Tax=Gamsiella multidivaricata TaxID=101098 RepID=UPI002220FAB5|nr:uncharacterized protein BC939DRAFT_467931 [Gamsiella multidivaricata]KAI7816740.1 hypothetical protein BC939DRAFT_467931 [Gamsiella multidivaricata]
MSVLARSPARLFGAAPLRNAYRFHAQQPASPAQLRVFSSNKSHSSSSDPSQTQASAQSVQTSTDSDRDSSSSGKPLGKVSGIVNSILHGSGSLPKVQSQESWGASLSRGKYVHELQKHRIRPERFDDYVQLVSEVFPRLVKESNNKLRLTGSWLTEIGELDTAVHIWEFDGGYLGHTQEMNRLRKDPGYQKFLKDLRPMLLSRDNQICLEFAFWKSRPPVDLGGIYEMRTYLLKPGNLLEWETNWRRGLECRRQFCEPVGAWFSQLGKLNYVHHMWNYPDLETRKKTREQAWKVDGWAETVYNTVRLIDSMEANILLPMDFSSLK